MPLRRSLLLLTLLCTGCDPQTPAPPPATPRSFNVRGVIEAIPLDRHCLTINHEAIPQFMPAMTMDLTVKNPREMEGLQAGDTVTFRLLVGKEDHWIEDLQRVTSIPLKPPQVPPTYPNLAHPAQLKIGEFFPDVELLRENGSTLRLADFRGQAVALTLIFTRCPLPDFCPRMNLFFQQTRALLRADQTAPANWQLISLSFDPDFDSPTVLAQHALQYRGDNPDRWLFATTDKATIANFAKQFDFHFTSPNGSLVHNLRTLVLDPQGRLHQRFDGNQWTPQDLAKALAEAAVKK